jgi:hypothetical protein
MLLCVMLAAAAARADSRVPRDLHPLPLPALPTASVQTPSPAPIHELQPAPPPHRLLPADLVVYSGQSPASTGIEAAPWGGGDAEDSTAVSYSGGDAGGHAIRIATYGLYEGGQLTFAKPFPLGSADPAAGRYLQFFIRFPAPDDQTTLRPDRSPSSGLLADYLWSAIQERQLPPQNPGEVGWLPPVGNFRFLFTLASGAEYEILRPALGIGYDNTLSLQDYWFPISIPVSALKFKGGADSSPVQSITISADGAASFYVGRIQIAVDHTPITGSAGTPMDVAAGEDVIFQAAADGGASMLHYSWDFDAADGITEDGSGPVVSHRFVKGGRAYTVTLTITDIDGIKPAVVTTVPVKVEE